MKIVVIVILFINSSAAGSGTISDDPWYEQGPFSPKKRVELTIVNNLNIRRTDVPVVVERERFPVQDLYYMDVTVVDPALEPRSEPTFEELSTYGYHQIRAEKNGRMIFSQIDDLDKNGIWDELFFIIDLEPLEEKIIYVYLGHNDLGMNPHTTTAGMGNYGRNLIPYWESENIGWKLWYPTDVDVYAKREPQLVSNYMVQNNYDGYGLPESMGSDIMAVEMTLGGGGLVLFEDEDNPDHVSRPRFTPAREKSGSTALYNVGQLSDTRYSYDVIVNGPIRSMVKVRTMNWFTGNGFYELEQTYTAYTRQSYSAVEVRFTRFNPMNQKTVPGAGIRRHPNEVFFRQHDNLVVSGGSEKIVNPDEKDPLHTTVVDYTVSAIVVPSKYEPQYQFVEDFKDNHVFQVTPDRENRFEYLIASAWSEGPPFDTMDDFHDYIKKTALEYDNPPEINIGPVEKQ